MQVGSLRESVIIALPIYNFGEQNRETGIPITETEVDLKLFSQPYERWVDHWREK